MWKASLLVAFVLLRMLLVVNGSECPFSAGMHSSAIRLHKHRARAEKSLLRTFFMKETDPGAVENMPFTWPGVNPDELKNAEILLDYSSLIRNKLISSSDAGKMIDFDMNLVKYTECVPKQDRCSSRNVKCNQTDKWRTYDGTCNNIENWIWGARNTQYNRLLNATYDDGINSIRRSVVENKELPSPRKIGNAISRWDQKYEQNENVSYENNPNVFALMMGQIIAHDLGATVKKQISETAQNGIQCCANSFEPLSPNLRNSHCIPITLPSDDKFFAANDGGCQNFIRAQNVLAKNCTLGPAEKLSIVGSYLDLHLIYSHSLAEVSSLRTFSGGQFALNKKKVLIDGPTGYRAGDFRAKQTPWLALLHSIWYRLHNYIANLLAKTHTDWNDEKLFNETRRITIAIYEHLLYEEWVPLFLGTEYSNRVNLTCKKSSGSCNTYDPKIDASNLAEFSQGAHRSFHANVPSTVNYYSEDFIKLKSVDLSDAVDKPTTLEENYNEILRGMLQDAMETKRIGCSSELRNKFLKNERGVGYDLCAVDIMRGRDFGVPPYIDHFQRCAGTTISSWNGLTEFFSEGHLRLLKRIYKNVKDIDLIVGVMLEPKQFGTYGVIGACIIGEQFHRSKFGNRFFYTFQESPYPFNKAQIREIKRVTFAKMICWTTDLKKVPKRSLEFPSEKNPMKQCDNVRPLDINLFG